ncbi:MAG: GH33 [uncultured Thermomicrobiales bacterium]|uniref:GH33 n=1 Tax=uncultured Thermomicrobiales bacterium TaxID=1645740 RepID=A0A6J4V9K4_9BACT|nr:MAG: GH33 [uncultured Thermomicrobiales bacterium]
MRRASPTPTSMPRGGSSPLVILALVALLSPLLGASVRAAEPMKAEEPGEEISPRAAQLLAPVAEFLGGSSYLVAEGLDPRVFDTPEADAMMGYGQAPNTGSFAAAVTNQQVPFRNAAPAFSRNVILTNQLGYAPYQTEPHLAVDPLDPEHLVAGVIDYNFGGAAAYVSFDGGETWEGPKPVRYFRDDISAGGDPVVTFDRQGNVYMAQISIGVQDFRVGGLASSSLVSTLAVAKSLDGGLNWEEPAAGATSRILTSEIADDGGRARGEVTIPFLDKEWITAGPDPANPENDLIHMSYTEFRSRYQVIYADEVPFLTTILTESIIKSVTSADGGITWSDPVEVSPTVFFSEGGGSPEEEGGGAQSEGLGDAALPDPPFPARQAEQADEGGEDEESARVVQGSQPAVLSDGTLVVAYHDTTDDGFQKGLATLMVAFSDDGGATFSEPTQAAVFQEVPGRPRSATFRLGGSGFPQIAIGPKDEIYLAHTRLPSDKTLDDGDVYLVRSLDRGATWDDAVRLNGDDTNRAQFYTSIDVSEDGVVHAMWGDMRDDPNEVRYHIYYTRSSDQGATWGFEAGEQGISAPDTRVSDYASNALKAFVGGRFIGDYFSLVANTEDVYMVWSDSRLGEYGGPNQQIAFARQTAIRNPEIFLNPPQGVAGRDITIQGFGFYPNSDIIITIGGVIASTLRSDASGQFQATIYTPLTGEGARNVAAYDPTGNVAVATFFTEFGFDSLQRSQQAMNDQLAALQAQVDALGGTPGASPVAGPSPTPTTPAFPTAASSPVPGATPRSSVGLTGGLEIPGLAILAAITGGLGAAYSGFVVGRRRPAA